jgi:hypothetical protein
MARSALILEISIFGFTFWLGLFLVARDFSRALLRWAGLGLIIYALGVAGHVLQSHAPSPELAARLARYSQPLLFLPPVFWSVTTVYLLPEGDAIRQRLVDVARPVPSWAIAVLAALLVYALGTAANLTVVSTGARPIRIVFAALVLVPLLASLYLIARAWRLTGPQPPVAVYLVGLLFLSLSAGLLLLLADVVWPGWLLAGLGIDLLLLGGAVAVLDACAAGEALLPDLFRSFDYSFFTTLIFAGQIGLAMVVATGVTFPMLTLLLTILAASIAVQTLSDSVQAAVDQVAFARFPRLRQARAELRVTASALARTDPTLDLEAMDEEEFTRLTRRALSNFGNLPRLASSPLTRLPIVEARLAARNAPGSTLERAAELKAVLAESIERLKPRGEDDFGTTDEWRFYNALYFPSVVGLRPYSRRADHDDLDPAAEEALDWFRTTVPDRTLYNWQSAAAELVAQDLAERVMSDE